VTTFDEAPTTTTNPGVTTGADIVGDATDALKAATGRVAPAAGAAAARTRDAGRKAAESAGKAARGSLRLMVAGLATAWPAYLDWRAVTEADPDIDAARAAGSFDRVKDFQAQQRNEALHRTELAAAAARVGVAVLFGGWLLATIAHVAACAAAFAISREMKPNPQKFPEPKARAQVRFRHALVAALVSAALTFVDAAVLGVGWGVLPFTAHPAGFCWGWDRVFLAWPGAALVLVLLALMKMAWNGTVADDLPSDLAPAEVEKVDTTENVIIAALKASSIKLPPDADPAIVSPGVTWHAGGTVWRCHLDTAKGGRGPSAAPIVEPKPAEDFAARLGLGPKRLHMHIDPDLGSRVELIGVIGDPWGPPTRSPLMDVDRWDLWQGVPFGMDIMKQRVDVQVAFRNRLHGGAPDAGKSTSTYPVQAAFVLSPNSRLWVLDGGEVDTKPLYDHGLTYRWCNNNQDDALDILMELDAEVERRQTMLGEYGKDHPRLGKKVSLQFFADHGLGFDLLLWDEMATFTNSGDKALARDIMKTGTSIFQRCRKVGIHVLLSTQSPSSLAIDTDGRDVISDRYALACSTPQMSDKILGQGHVAEGTNAAKLTVGDRLGYLSDSSGDRLVRADYLTDDDMDIVYARGKALRKGRVDTRAGSVPPLVSAAVRLLRERGVEWMHTAEVVGRLRAAGHDLSEGVKGQRELAAALKPFGAASVEVRADGGRARYLLDDLEAALRKAGGGQ
jgi:S-DNA-T family DNA segregation ATPase FtsK/SpoIIIE